ncbi:MULTISPECIES: hypothetical protein [Streptomyces]|uniref:Uncharacterized protein n=1 Tax=Streptomyces cacaoi TaxID=1898 RepID=A0A4Y3R810_STRCI|nr:MULTISPECIES: hypothetical protein [Streptomyces]NNG86381.1 hypothetical protein [Streptomyces cacaoi]QHF93269.1 hypothetical protein DEH18_04470 [Streptomyces sp. NHF165]GEB52857.1 hypothetical protein SCA03_54080 [Streptomyces cacaoi]
MSDIGQQGGTGEWKPGDGYKIQISSVRKILKPLEESVVAARKIKDDWKPMAENINTSATIDIVSSAKGMLSSWGYGMGRVAEHTDTVVKTLHQVLVAYMMADLLGIKNFEPTADNMAKLPFGEAGIKAWQQGSRPHFDPAPDIYQEPWMDDDGSESPKEAGGAGPGNWQDVPRNPRQRYDGGWETDGGDKVPMA